MHIALGLTKSDRAFDKLSIGKAYRVPGVLLVLVFKAVLIHPFVLNIAIMILAPVCIDPLKCPQQVFF